MAYALTVSEDARYVGTWQALRGRRSSTWGAWRMALLTGWWNDEGVQGLSEVTKLANAGWPIECTEDWALGTSSVNSIKFFNTTALISVPNFIGWTLWRSVLSRRWVRLACVINKRKPKACIALASSLHRIGWRIYGTNQTDRSINDCSRYTPTDAIDKNFVIFGQAIWGA